MATRRSIGWRDLGVILARSLDEWTKHKAPRLGASLSFYTLLSIAPLLMVLVFGIALVIGPEAAQKSLIEQVQILAGRQGAAAAEFLLQGTRSTGHGVVATVAGLVTLLFGASGVMIELRDALNIIWDVCTPELKGLKEVYGFLKERLFSFAIVLAMGFVLLLSLAVSAAISALGTLSATTLPAHVAVLHVVSSIASFCVVTGLFAAIYKFVPDVKIEWEDVVLGAAVTSMLFTLGKLAIGIYLGTAAFGSMYGAAGSIVLFIVWVYYSAQIFFFGAEFTKLFSQRYGSQSPAPPLASKSADALFLT